MLNDPSDVLKRNAEWCKDVVIVALFALIFCYLGAVLGSMTMEVPVVGTILGAIIGLVLGLIVGYYASGRWKQWFERGGALDIPKAVQPLVYNRNPFVLIVTVVDVKNQVHAQFRPNDTYVMISCGRNPVKTTCVRREGKWNETFKLTVDPRDKSLNFYLMDQDVMLDDTLGNYTLPIDDLMDMSITELAHLELPMTSREQRAGTLIVSIIKKDCGDAAVPNDTRLGQTGGPYGTFYFSNVPSIPNTDVLQPPTATRLDAV